MADKPFDAVVLGLGYIGLPTAAVIARSGLDVLGVDVNQHAVDTVEQGRIHIEEVDLEALVQGVVARGMLKTALKPAPADVFVIAVPTPFKDDHVPDISYVLAATTSIAPCLRKGDTVIIESTSPVGTTEQARDLLAELRPDLKFPYEGDDAADVAMCYCPERVLPGRILIELIENDRCIGGITPACAERALAFYKRFVHGECIVTKARAAEMVKLVENAFRDVNIAFANEISLVCDKMDLNVWEVIALANRHPRVNVLKPGPGVGGHCIAVDPWFIVDAAPDRTPLIRTAREVNDGKVDYVVDQAVALLEADPALKLAALGLAFKANVDDLRESPAVKVAAKLAQRFGDRVQVVEPYTAKLPRDFADTAATLTPLDEALDQCGAILLLVDHDLFRAIPRETVDAKQVIDTRGLWTGA